MSQVDILAVFAHPDDLELLVGGTMAKLKSLGYATGALDVTRGEMGTRGTVEGRAIEAEEAAKILGLDVRDNLGLPDGHDEQDGKPFAVAHQDPHFLTSAGPKLTQHDDWLPYRAGIFRCQSAVAGTTHRPLAT